MLTKILIICTLTTIIVNVKAYNFEYLVPICPPETDGQPVFIPNVDCTKYYECSHGRPILMQCPAGLYFNPILNVCDHKEDSGCNQTNKQARLRRNDDGHVYIPHENLSKFYRMSKR
uniref:Peritrophic matrix protein n=1 Tax=Epicauta chinensis TaxID=941254 RepID=A0A2R2WRS0_9CUCU|nr:peritrophic matrix protein [Epicauta chinensis]